MSVTEHYEEALDVLHKTFRHIFEGLEERYAKELAVVREQYPSEPIRFTEKPLIIHWPEGMKMLKDAGVEVPLPYVIAHRDNVSYAQHGELDDLSTAVELKLGELVKEKYDADFYILDQVKIFYLSVKRQSLIRHVDTLFMFPSILPTFVRSTRWSRR